MGTRYGTDFYLWTQEEATKLRSGNVKELDLENLAEEIESMGRNDKRELRNRIVVLLVHLLKVEYQRHKQVDSTSWLETIDEQRDQISVLLQDSPSLKQLFPGVIEEAHKRAIRKAAKETGLSESAFPATCPYSAEQILNETYLPSPNQQTQPTSIRLRR